MTAGDLIQALPTTLLAARDLVVQAIVLTKVLSHLLRRQPTGAAYENLSLDLSLDIRDPRGARATLDRRQRVRFLRAGSGVIRDLIWGDGRPLARYAVTGAQRLTVLPEGSRSALLLGGPYPTANTNTATIQSRRLIRNGLRGRTEYCEALVERPTHRLAMNVVFPVSRPPREAHLVTVTAHPTVTRVPLRFRSDGRPYLSWRTTRPALNTIYSLRWSW